MNIPLLSNFPELAKGKPMKHKTYFAYLILAIAMSGCLKVNKKNAHTAAAKPNQAKPQTIEPRQEISRELRLDDIFVEYAGQRRPNVYDILLSWPKTRDHIRISLNNKIIFTANTAEVLQYKLEDQKGGDSFEVLIEILDSNSKILASESRPIEVPEDVVISDEFILTRDVKIHRERVFLLESLITTQNFNLEIMAKELIVMGRSTIQNYSSTAKAAVGKVGRDGGAILIDAEIAEGELLLTLNSEAGGDGLQGYYETRLVGKEKNEIRVPKCINGGNGYPAGRNGSLRLKVKNIDNFYYYPTTTISSGGSHGPRLGQVPLTYPAVNEGSGCPENPISGANAVEGAICLLTSKSTPEQGCE